MDRSMQFIIQDIISQNKKPIAAAWLLQAMREGKLVMLSILASSQATAPAYNLAKAILRLNQGDGWGVAQQCPEPKARTWHISGGTQSLWTNGESINSVKKLLAEWSHQELRWVYNVTIPNQFFPQILWFPEWWLLRVKIMPPLSGCVQKQGVGSLFTTHMC